MVGWGLCVGSLKVDLWNFIRNEDFRYICVEDGLGMLFNFYIVLVSFVLSKFGFCYDI